MRIPYRGLPRRPLKATGARARLVLLGTAGGSAHYPDQWRQGVASAVVVDSAVYLIDCGEGAALRYRQAGLGPSDFGHGLEALRAIFLTHLHSDHTVGLPGILVAGALNGLRHLARPIQIHGPGPGQSPGTPGVGHLIRGIFDAYAADLNERNSGRASALDPRALFDVREIGLPPGADRDPLGDLSPPIEPFPIFDDANVRVTATLVDHRPAFPVFAFRFDTEDGAIVLSGDTRPHGNLVRLARGADILVHDVVATTAMARHLTSPELRSRLDVIAGKHSTVDEVDRVAAAAGVRTLVLSPIGPPDATDEDLRSLSSTFSGRVIFGQDLDEVGLQRPPK